MQTKNGNAAYAPAAFPLMCALAATFAFGSAQLHAQGANRVPLFLTATNASTNMLAVINTRTQETVYVPTGGAGGVSGNAGGVAVSGELAAVINYGSSNVTIFQRVGNAMEAMQMVKVTSKPVSVAFGHDHLVVLTVATVESFPVYGNSVGNNDGIVNIVRNDGTAGQIVTYDGGAVYSETSGVIAQVSLSTNGAAGVSGPNMSITLPPAPNNNTPLGMVGRGPNVYATIAHSDLEVLISNGQIISMAQGPSPFMDAFGNLTHAPCWNTLSGQFLFSADSPGKQVVRFLVSDANVFFDKTAVATLSGSPTDLFASGSLLAIIDGGNGSGSDASVFTISSEGELTLRFSVKISASINGAAIID